MPPVFEKAVEDLVVGEYFAQVAGHRGPYGSIWLAQRRKKCATMQLRLEIAQVYRTNKQRDGSFTKQ